jgi:hypothetical protein
LTVATLRVLATLIAAFAIFGTSLISLAVGRHLALRLLVELANSDVVVLVGTHAMRSLRAVTAVIAFDVAVFEHAHELVLALGVQATGCRELRFEVGIIRGRITAARR